MRTASTPDIPVLVDILESSFESDPHVRWFIGDPAQPQQARLRRRTLMRLLACHAVSCKLAGISDDRKGAVLWQQYGVKPRGFRFVLANIAYLLRCGPGPTLKSLAMEKEVQKRLPAKPHLFLWTIGILEEARGKGQFRDLIAPMLKKADQEGLPVYLETTVPENIPRYEHYGFKTLECYQYRDSPVVSFMCREAKLLQP